MWSKELLLLNDQANGSSREWSAQMWMVIDDDDYYYYYDTVGPTF